MPTACCFLAIVVPAHLTPRSFPHSCVMPQEHASLQLPVLNKISHGPRFLGEFLFQSIHRSVLRSRSRHLELESAEGVRATAVSQPSSRRRNSRPTYELHRIAFTHSAHSGLIPASRTTANPTRQSSSDPTPTTLGTAIDIELRARNWNPLEYLKIVSCPTHVFASRVSVACDSSALCVDWKSLNFIL